MSYGNFSKKTEGGQGGKRGHSNMCHWTGTEEIKEFSKKSRRNEDRKVARGLKYDEEDWEE